MNRKIKILVSVSAALPIQDSDPRLRRTVFNFRGNVDTAHFLGKLFRVLNQVLGLGGGSPGPSTPTESFSSPPLEESPSTSPPPRGRSRRSPRKPRSRTPKKNHRRRRTGKQRMNSDTDDEHSMPRAFPVEPLAAATPFDSPPTPPPSPVDFPDYQNTLWKASERLLRTMTLAFLEHLPKHQFDESHVQSQRILVSLLEMMYAENTEPGSPVKWTCTLAMILLFLKDTLLQSSLPEPNAGTKQPLPLLKK